VKPAIFLDRDGTLIEDVGYLDRVERVSIYPFTMDALRLLRRAGFQLVVVTNQSGVARGLFDESLVGEVHDHLTTVFARGGVTIDGYYHCPHFAEARVERYRVDCDCRKPKPGMIERAARDLDLDVSRSYVIGDHWSDVGLANAVGARGILVRTGSGSSQAERPAEGVRADAVLPHLMAAATWILLDSRLFDGRLADGHERAR
jgi:D-glycero-D-manno-heptose 1,7-bisphosphate phosphatase